LLGLAKAGVISAPRLEAFRAAGFLFDHGIRCQLPDSLVRKEWQLARKYESGYAELAVYLRPLLASADNVWVMGYIARNAAVCQGIPELRQDRAITPPYFLTGNRRVFVSRYLSRASGTEGEEIFRHVSEWLTS
jgi:hypothetical protein